MISSEKWRGGGETGGKNFPLQLLAAILACRRMYNPASVLEVDPQKAQLPTAQAFCGRSL